MRNVNKLGKLQDKQQNRSQQDSSYRNSQQDSSYRNSWLDSQNSYNSQRQSQQDSSYRKSQQDSQSYNSQGYNSQRQNQQNGAQRQNQQDSYSNSRFRDCGGSQQNSQRRKSRPSENLTKGENRDEQPDHGYVCPGQREAQLHEV